MVVGRRAAHRPGERCRRPAGVEVRGYVHELYRHLAACDLAVVQGGLTTTMELVGRAAGPFVYVPLRQPLRAAASTSATGSTATARASWLDYADADAASGSPTRSPSELGARPSYRPVDAGGAARAAASIAELLRRP